MLIHTVYPAVPEGDDLVNASKHFPCVGDYHKGLVELPVQVLHEAYDVVRGSGVEVSGGLVPKDEGLSRSPSMLSSVDLPEPDCPTIRTNSPFLISKDTESRASVRASPLP